MTMLTYVADSSAPAETAWRLIAEPRQWNRWAPHLRGASGLGDPEVEVGAEGQAHLIGGVSLPAHVVSKQAGRSWTWTVGPVRLRHRVAPRAHGCRAAVDIEAPFGLESVIRVTYGPLAGLLMQNLARVAAQDDRRARRRARVMAR